MAPILAFTCEEAWAFVPAYPGKEPFIHLARFPETDENLRRGVDDADGRGSWPSATAS